MKKMNYTLICLLGLLLWTTPAAALQINYLVVGYESPTTSTATIYFSGTPPFSVYRSLDGNDWGTALISDLAAFEYTDTNLTNEVNYYYKIEQNEDGASAIAPAYPPNNNIHTSLRADTTYLCASCHVAHSAGAVYLLNQPTIVALCTTCHDGSQSKYDVLNGKVKLATGFGDTSGGPFGPLQPDLPVNLAVYADSRSVSPVEVPVNPTSIHNLGNYLSAAPGGVSDLNIGLSCLDCHEIHNISGNFRNLKSSIKITDTTSIDINFKAYARTDDTFTSGYGEDVYYDTGSIFFCSACHSDYNQPTGSGNTAATSTQVPGLSLSTATMNKFVHAVNTPLIFRGEYYTSSLPLESGTGVNVVVCLTCHQAHGTFKVGNSKVTNSSALLRMDRQGVCEECHKK